MRHFDFTLDAMWKKWLMEYERQRRVLTAPKKVHLPKIVAVKWHKIFWKELSTRSVFHAPRRTHVRRAKAG